MKNKIYILSAVTIADEKFKQMIDSYVAFLEDSDNEVYHPRRDTDQNEHPFNISVSNVSAIRDSDEVHIFYDSESLGSHFDLGALFYLEFMSLDKKKRKIKLIEFRLSSSNSMIYRDNFVKLIKRMEDWRDETI